MKCPKCNANNAEGNLYCHKCGSSLIIIPKKSKKLPKLAAGDYFADRYQIITHIKRDEMGRIYKAFDKTLNKVVTLRMINPGLSTNPWPLIVEKIKKLLPQKKDATPVSLTKLYDIGNVGDIKYITMKYREPESPKISKKLIISSSAVLIALISLTVFLAIIKMKPKTTPAEGPKKKSIAIMYFENNTGDEKLDHWREALSDLLITDLAQSKYLRVLSKARLFNILQQLDQLEAKEYSLEVLQQVAEKGKVDYILLGNYSKSGNQFRINIKIQEVQTGELLNSETVEGIGEESLFALVDDLTGKIKFAFELSPEEIAWDIDKEVGKITTSSPEAYKYYSEGRRYHNKGNFRKSIKSMDRAIAIDSQFAMAYRSKAMTYSHLLYFADMKENLQKAMILSDRVSDKELYLIQGNYYGYQENTLDKAIEAYEKLLQLYPDDSIANNNLGIIYWELEKWDKAIEKYQVGIKSSIENNDISYIDYMNLAYAYMSKGLYNKAIDVCENYLIKIQNDTVIHRTLAEIYLCLGKYDLALREINQALSLEPDYFDNIITKGDIYHMQGDFIEAEKEYLKLLELKKPIDLLSSRTRLGALYLLQGKINEAIRQFKHGIIEAQKLGEMRWESGFHSLLAYLYLKSGNPADTLKECDIAFNIAAEVDYMPVQRNALHYKGISFLEMNSMDKAAETAEKLRGIIEEGMNQKNLRYYHHLMGMMELRRNNFSSAIEYFQKALSVLYSQNSENWAKHNRHALYIESLASAYYQAGDIEKARIEYEKITALTTGRIMFGDIYAKSYYMLGKIYQQKDWKGKAIENYETFLTLWKDADPTLPELVDSKKQLAILQAT